MNTPKRHHVVPQMFLRRFCDSGERLWIYNKRAPSLGVYHSSTNRSFYETHFYTMRDEKGNDTTLESRFSTIEGNANTIIDNICRSARAGKQWSLSAADKELWDEFFYYQWKRTPDFINSIESYVNFDETLASVVLDYERSVRTLTEDERTRLAEKKKEIRESARVRAMADPGEEVRHVLSRTGLAALLIRHPRKSFIVGSNPIVKLTIPGRTLIGDPIVEIWLPISSDVALGITPVRKTGTTVIIDDYHKLRKLNLSIFRQSTVIGGRSRDLLNSLISNR